MKLLIITQKVDRNDSNLGFFHVWLQKLAEHVDHLYVICLQEGEHALDREKVTVLSLGKESGASRLKYVWRFYKHIWGLRKSYDGVFVHMNPEYVILGGLLWRPLGKKVLLWYTHKAVNFKLWLAEKFATKIFTASKESFRLVSKKIEVTGHGIPVENFNDPNFKNLESLKSNTLFLMSVGRITPSKDWETVILAVAEIMSKKIDGLKTVSFLVAGAPITQDDINYGNRLKELAKSKGNMAFIFQTYPWQNDLGGMPYVYQSKHILVHTSRTGSMDKVVLEALAAGRLVVTSSEAYAGLADGELGGVVFRFRPGDYQELANTIEKIYKAGIIVPNQKAIDYVRKNHNLDTLVGKIMAYFAD